MEENKAVAIEFLRLVTSGRVREAYDNWVGPTFKHHNPYFAAGAEALMGGMETNAREFPSKLFEVQHAVAEGELVAVHSRLHMKANDPPIAVVHLFRLAGGRIVELWDVGQPMPAESPNADGMF